MNLFSRHLLGLIDFKGRENRQPFWLWILVVYILQIIAWFVVMIPLMMDWFHRMEPIMRNSPRAFDDNPQLPMQMMMPMMQNMMTASAVMAVILIVLVAAAVVRRLHDSNRSGWWAMPVFAMQIVSPLVMGAIFPRYFAAISAFSVRPGAPPPDPTNPAFQSAMQTMTLVSSVNMLGFALFVMLVVFLALPGTAGPNRFGDDPLAAP